MYIHIHPIIHIYIEFAAKAEVASSVVEECFLCESPVEVKFEPCGHAVLCAICSERAKKCVKCKVCTHIVYFMSL